VISIEIIMKISSLQAIHTEGPSDVYKVSIVYGYFPDTVFTLRDTCVSTILGESTTDCFGWALGSGDINDDGIKDLFIGAYRANPEGRTSAGKAYLFYGVDTITHIPPPPTPILVLMQNYPNPFSFSTTIEYSLPHPSPAMLSIYNILGQRIARLAEPEASQGTNFFRWNGRNARGQRVASGLYLYRVEAGGEARTKKMILLR
jgi:hypothetical protein